MRTLNWNSDPKNRVNAKSLLYLNKTTKNISLHHGGISALWNKFITELGISDIYILIINDFFVVLEIYADRLIKEGVVTAEEVKDVKDKYEKICEDAYNQAKQETHIKYKDWLDSPWSGFFEGKDPLKVRIHSLRYWKF